MIPFISKNIFRLQENILGRPSFRILNQLKKSQFYSKKSMDDLRLKRLKSLISSAYTNTDYWKEIMDKNGISPKDINYIEDLKKFPLLKKETLRTRREDMVFRDEGKRLQLVRTSGSTNEALEFYTSSLREAHINAARMRGHEWAGVSKGEKEMYYWGSPVELNKQDRIKRVRDFFVNDGLTNGFEINEKRIKDYYKYWIKWSPKIIFGYPSTLVLTVNISKKLNLDLRKLKQNGLKVIVTTSEMLSEPDRKIIESGFGVKIHDSYGLREAGLIGYECEKNTMHTMDEQLILETIDPKTLKPVKGQGELVVTNLVGKAFPIIRYRTGDIVKLSSSLCSCGKKLSSIKISGGRAVEFIITKNKRLIAGYSFIYIARSVKGIVKFQIIQEKLGEIIVKLAIDDNFPSNGEDLVKTAVLKRLKSDDKIVIKIVDDIKPAPSGKYRPVISKISHEIFS